MLLHCGENMGELIVKIRILGIFILLAILRDVNARCDWRDAIVRLVSIHADCYFVDCKRKRRLEGNDTKSISLSFHLFLFIVLQ